MSRYIELPIPVDERVPEGHKLIVAYTNGVDVIVPFDPCELKNGDDHNCDWEGCSSINHVLRISPEQKYALVRGKTTKEVPK